MSVLADITAQWGCRDCEVTWHVAEGRFCWLCETEGVQVALLTGASRIKFPGLCSSATMSPGTTSHWSVP